MWPVKVAIVRPLNMLHSRIVSSPLPLARILPSGRNATEVT